MIGFACFIVVISIFVMPWVVMLALFVYEESRTKPWDDFRDEQDHAE